ncbi:aminomethyl-transferring glycine dehydrogenase subunit GcvPA [Geoalkalibacter subterraneus]|uniref:Probable glycine dehydrogenase (decarboxylating) subunit 1 n=1 Tax=Geoalkalibacter subterraneus TaxID=483547 RepID=A0A0B5FG41_9BACT|nr:aminomethyl-transferring glycine dehydrogenase subunit GcvPA [Geoalkalibacter subterraneus]AJF07092.1 glycine dehydrogenase [Geoalkalibacter subterraneus]
MRYIPHNEEDVLRMLDAIGVDTLESLFEEVPSSLRHDAPLNLPAARAESDLLAELARIARCNGAGGTYRAFLGAGAYDHFIPAVVDHLLSRSEFYTAYTPYQPEISQGTLQAIFEFQTLICQLTGMGVANASMYDGASSCAEAVLMACRVTRRRKVILSRALHPDYLETIRTYGRYLDMEWVDLPFGEDGAFDPDALSRLLDEECAAVVVGYPNFFGVMEDLATVSRLAHEHDARLVVAVQEPLSLGLFKSPGELGADIVVGEGQSFGLPLSYGGPYLGFFAARESDVRNLPGRLVGETVDTEGRRGFVLTLATREQHIRREKATSNICSNQGLCALAATIYLALLGRQGLPELARHNYSKACYARERIAAVDGYSLPFNAPVFNEFVVEGPRAAEGILQKLQERDILGGVALSPWFPDMSNRFLVCVTERNCREDIDAFVEALSGGEA